ncbi:putative tail collar domain-containing protein [Pseudomonas phage PPpW-3]|uniref:Putative tail collar domain-containing protein n=1 Tax=Pseudomonas phage PPpW-3 TaxID=1279082 RepID=V5YTB8_9CAUD|nr:tail protein [Pseudomonas phage PPpW-3]BAO20617.1 putative tail collar domain-containing protein [Pseudomonas phage PPpW-3]
MLCYGQAVSRTTYAGLFAVIGITYGAGDGSTTFNLPDLRGRVPAGVDNMGGTAAGRLTTAAGGVNAAVLGAVGGASTHTLTAAQMPGHTHAGTTAAGGAHKHNIPAKNSDGSGTNDTTTLMYGTTKTESTFTYMATAAAHTHTFTTDSAGGGAAHPVVQPTMALNHIIRI